MDPKKQLLLKIIKAENETEVEKILESDPFAKSLHWWPFNDTETNFSTINNQQTDPIGALVEKPINSIDAIMMKECMLVGIEADSSSAPKTMAEAIEKFFKVEDGDISNLDEKQVRKLASNIRIIAEGEKDKPNIVIADCGEGQNPADFKETLLSLHRKNKLRIQFVQGKYGMGGTGVISFCGNNKYQLILARRCPKLLKDGQKDLWGFTLVRRTPSSKLNERDRHSWYECLMDENREILAFQGESLPILPNDETLEHGCFIKLFNYDLPHPSFATVDLWRDLNRKLYSPALPILVQETRTKHFNITRGKNDTRILIGNRLRIKKDDRAFVHLPLTINADLKSFGRRKVDVVVFKDFDEKGEDLRKRHEWSTPDETVFLTINGQTHHSLSRYWLRKTGLDYLIDYLFVHVDCTSVSRAVTDDIFLGSRDRVRNNEAFRAFEDALTFALKTNEVLQKLNEEYRQRALAKVRPDKSIAKKLVMDLISKNKGLMSYFASGSEVPVGSIGTDVDEIPKTYQGVYIPTYLRPRKKFSGICLEKDMPKNARHAMVLLETDAQNDYFDRKENRGRFTWTSSDARAKVSTHYLFNGLLPIRVNVLDPVEGEVLEYCIEVSRPGMEPLKVTFKIRITEAQERLEHDEREPRHKALQLPQLVAVRQTPGPDEESWEKHGWTGSDIAKVDRGIVYVNMDSNDLKNYMNQCPKKLRSLAETVYKTGIYLNAIILDIEFGKMQSLNGVEEEVFRAAIGSTSKTLLPMYLDPQIQKIAEQAEQE